jgi:hypothetical protein
LTQEQINQEAQELYRAERQERASAIHRKISDRSRGIIPDSTGADRNEKADGAKVVKEDRATSKAMQKMLNVSAGLRSHPDNMVLQDARVFLLGERFNPRLNWRSPSFSITS